MTASSSIAPIINALPRTTRLSEYWQWWTGELRALIPQRLMNWVVGDVAVTDMMIEASGVTLIHSVSGKATTSAVIPFAETATHPLLAELRTKGQGQVRVLLGADQVLQKRISLPAAIEENLREVMGFELDRHTPFVASQAYYDVKLLRRDPQRDVIDVLLAVAARAVVDPLLAAVRQAGLSVEGITVVGADSAGQAIELLPARDKPARKWGNLLRLNLALLAVALLLGLVALLLPIWQKREEAIALNPLIGKSAVEFEVSQRINDEYTRLANEYNYIVGKKHSMYPSLAILEELTKISPDTTAAQSMDLKSTGKTREVTLIGEAQVASKVIEALEQSPLFQNATQRSQTRRGSLGTNEWFHIATEVKPKSLPPSILADEKPPEPVVAPPAALTAPPVNAMLPAADPTKTTAGTLPVIAKPDVSAEKVAPAPAPAKPTANPAEQAAPPAIDRKQP